MIEWAGRQKEDAMKSEVRTLGRILAMHELTADEIEFVAGGNDGSDFTFVPSQDSMCQGKADDCQNDHLM
jgi:hypothetical protein